MLRTFALASSLVVLVALCAPVQAQDAAREPAPGAVGSCRAQSGELARTQRAQVDRELGENHAKADELSLVGPSAAVSAGYGAAFGLVLAAVGTSGRDDAISPILAGAAVVPLALGVVSSVWLHRRSNARMELARTRRALRARARLLDRQLALATPGCEQPLSDVARGQRELSEIDARLADIRGDRESYGLPLPIVLVAVGAATAVGMSFTTLVMFIVYMGNDEENPGLSSGDRRVLRNMGSVAVAGAGVAAAGAGLLIFRVRQRSAMRDEYNWLSKRKLHLQTTVVPSVSTNYLGLSLQGRF